MVISSNLPYLEDICVHHAAAGHHTAIRENRSMLAVDDRVNFVIVESRELSYCLVVKNERKCIDRIFVVNGYARTRTLHHYAQTLRSVP